MQQLDDYYSILGGSDTVLLRVDFNIARNNQGEFVLNDRVYGMVPVIKRLLAVGCAVVLVSHLGRPTPGVWQAQHSFVRLVGLLEKCLRVPVEFLSKWPHQKTYMASKTVALAENTRFLEGELENDSALVKKMLRGIDLVVMEAFACSHRAHASTVGIVSQAKRVCLGIQHYKELKAITSFQQLKGSRLAVVGGKKLATKLPLIYQLLDQIDVLCLGGGLANTLLHSIGYNLGTSWVEYDQLAQIKALVEKARTSNVRILYPEDVIVGTDSENFDDVRAVAIDAIGPHEQIIDIGMQTRTRFIDVIKHADTVYWNGPLGRYEYANGMAGSAMVGQSIAKYPQYSLVGGGDTLSCLHRLGLEGFSHVSTGGGAFLYYFAHQSSPVLQALESRGA